MRLANVLRTLLLPALPVVLVTCAAAQEHPNVLPSNVRDQLNQGSAAPLAQPAPPKPALLSPQAEVPPKAPRNGNAPAKAQSTAPETKTAAPRKAPAKTAAQNPAKPPDEKPAEAKAVVAHRDPFDALLGKPGAGNATVANPPPPGRAGLEIGTLRIDGIAGGASGLIAIVSNPQQRVYFLRAGDKLFDGSVDHITLEAVTFRQSGKDAFGKPLERQVTKRLYPSPGEQQ